MSRALAIALGLVLAATITTARARAQHASDVFATTDGPRHAVRAFVEMDPTLGLGLGYVRTLQLREGSFARRIALHFDVATILGFSSWDLTAGASMRLVEHTGLDALVTVDLETKIVQNDVHTGAVAGYGVAVRPGYFDPTWYAALDLSLRGTMAAALYHRDAYRELFPNATDGLVATDHLSMYVGAAIGFCIERVVVLGARFAWRFPRTFEDYAPYFLPYTLDVEVGFRL
jgi:hypothetical protein